MTILGSKIPDLGGDRGGGFVGAGARSVKLLEISVVVSFEPCGCLSPEQGHITWLFPCLLIQFLHPWKLSDVSPVKPIWLNPPTSSPLRCLSWSVELCFLEKAYVWVSGMPVWRRNGDGWAGGLEREGKFSSHLEPK